MSIKKKTSVGKELVWNRSNMRAHARVCECVGCCWFPMKLLNIGECGMLVFRIIALQAPFPSLPEGLRSLETQTIRLAFLRSSANRNHDTRRLSYFPFVLSHAVQAHDL